MHLDATADNSSLHPDPTPADPGCAAPGSANGRQAVDCLHGAGRDMMPLWQRWRCAAWSPVEDPRQAWGPVPCFCSSVCTE
ncbi:hypothetical protein ACRRTK_005444 [Alexandromys fortis]